VMESQVGKVRCVEVVCVLGGKGNGGGGMRPLARLGAALELFWCVEMSGVACTTHPVCVWGGGQREPRVCEGREGVSTSLCAGVINPLTLI
jgi:hypothetical protein